MGIKEILSRTTPPKTAESGEKVKSGAAPAKDAVRAQDAVPAQDAASAQDAAPAKDISGERRALIKEALDVRKRVREKLDPETIERLARQAGIKNEP